MSVFFKSVCVWTVVIDVLFLALRCFSHVGRYSHRDSHLSLGKNCNRVSVAAHELGHIIGFSHEQNRLDRDQYVDILWQNMKTGQQQFRTHKSRSVVHEKIGFVC